MPEWRPVGQPCPKNDVPLGMEGCMSCRFFRGVLGIDPVDGKFHGWKVLCAWPRDGALVWRRPLPEWLTSAFDPAEE